MMIHFIFTVNANLFLFHINILCQLFDWCEGRCSVNKAEMLYSRGCFCIYVIFTVSFQYYSKLLLK